MPVTQKQVEAFLEYVKDDCFIGSGYSDDEYLIDGVINVGKAIEAAIAAGDTPPPEAHLVGEPVVPITAGMPELRISLIARAVRQSLRNYGHKVAESTLPECIAGDVERTLVAHEKTWAKPPRDCGINGGDLSESRDNIGSAYTRSTPSPSTNVAAAIEALRGAEPYVELCHSLMSEKETRAQVWKVLKQVRAALATTEGQP